MKSWLSRLLCVLVVFCATGSFCAAQEQFATSGPIQPAERQTTEPPRTVAARDYRDAYCALWTDGCTTCERKSVNDRPACRDAAHRSKTCQPQRIACRAVLPTIGRVCLLYSDGCNTCTSAGACTVKGCSTVPISGQRAKPFTPDYICRHPRRAHYGDPILLRLELQGQWRLTDEGGRSCDLSIRHNVSVSPGCHALRPALAHARDAKIDGSTLRLVDRKNQPLLSFDTSDLDSLKGVDGSEAYRLIRLQ